eukprot:TRINITY_DN3983_c0_g1_i1.p1 TRINITY_DN3983_c0_g1~~TRINITY_DN3983_c0_g1_i1.p1  ORF type:complete len:377 (+),score=98.55 TRINITY_DN3983_c0_g1_i1:25-1131(+)
MKGRGSCEGAAPPTAVAHNRLLSRAGCVGGHHHTSALAFLAGWHHRTGAPSVMTAKDVSADIARYIVNLAFNSNIVVIGGAANDGPLLTDVDVFNPCLGKWTHVEPLPQPRSQLAAAIVRDHVYVLGGFVRNDWHSSVNTCLACDTTTWQWAPIPNMLEKRGAHVACAVGDLLFAIGGHGTSDNHLNAGEVFNVNTGTWEPLPASHGYDKSACCVSGDRIYIFGGDTSTHNPTDAVQAFDVRAWRWDDSLPLMPSRRFSHTASTVGGRVYVLGGMQDGSTPVPTIDVLDLATQAWSTCAGAPSIAHYAHTASVLGDDIVVVGGFNDGGSFHRRTDEVGVLHCASLAWEQLEPLPIHRSSQAACLFVAA